MTPEQFIDKWSRADRTERQAAQEHFIDLCRVLAFDAQIVGTAACGPIDRDMDTAGGDAGLFCLAADVGGGGVPGHTRKNLLVPAFLHRGSGGQPLR